MDSFHTLLWFSVLYDDLIMHKSDSYLSLDRNKSALITLPLSWQPNPTNFAGTFALQFDRFPKCHSSAPIALSHTPVTSVPLHPSPLTIGLVVSAQLSHQPLPSCWRRLATSLSPSLRLSGSLTVKETLLHLSRSSGAAVHSRGNGLCRESRRGLPLNAVVRCRPPLYAVTRFTCCLCCPAIVLRGRRSRYRSLIKQRV